MSNYPKLEAYEVKVLTKEPTFSYHTSLSAAFAAAANEALATNERPLDISVEPVTFVFFPTSDLPLSTCLYARLRMRAVGFFAADTGDDKIILGYLKDDPGDYYSLVYKCQPDENNPNRFDSDVVEPLLKQLLETASDNT